MGNSIVVKAVPGYTVAADGVDQPVRGARDGAVLVGDLHGRYYETASRGLSFVASTATAGIAPGTALSATPPMALLNPAGSGRNISIQKVFYSYVSGTLGVGTLFYVQGTNPGSLPAETAAAIRSVSLLGGSTSSPNDVAKAYSGISLTNTPVIVRPSAFSINPYAGTAAPLTLHPPLIEEIAGELVLAPGAWFGVQGIGAAGTSPLITIGISYEIVVP